MAERRITPEMLELFLRHLFPRHHEFRWQVRKSATSYAWDVMATVIHRRGRRQVRIAYGRFYISEFELHQMAPGVLARVVELEARDVLSELWERMERMRLVGWKVIADG